MDQYKNKIALVTGGSSGIGLAYAKYLIAHGWYVQIVSRNEERSNIAMLELGSANARNFLFDLTKEEFMFQRIGNGSYHQLEHWEKLRKKIVSI